MSRRPNVLIRFLSLLALALVFTGSGFSQKRCTNADWRGAYGFYGNGSIILPPGTPITGPFARAGLAIVDGNGGLVIQSTGSYNGFIVTESFDGRYEVNPDCTFTYVANLGPPINFPVVFTGVLSDGGTRGVFELINPPGTTISATFIRQGRARCSDQDMVGSFELYSTGAILPPSPDAGEHVRVGRLVAERDSSFTVTSTAIYEGIPRPETFSGTYAMHSDCTVGLRFLDGSGTPAQYDGVMVNGRDQILFILNSPGKAVTGVLTRQ